VSSDIYEACTTETHPMMLTAEGTATVGKKIAIGILRGVPLKHK
jgi:hypothetical protein